MQLTPNSVFVEHPATQAIVAAAGAATLQVMRADQRLSTNAFPVRCVLPLSDFDRYTDPILRATFLRVAYPTEMRRSRESLEQERTDWVRDRLRSNELSDRQLKPELIVGILTGKLPAAALDEETLSVLREEGYAEFCDLVLNNTL